MIKLFQLYIILNLIVGCSLFNFEKKSKNTSVDYSSVHLDKNKFNNQAIRIEEKDFETDQKDENEIKKDTALVFGPGIYFTLAYQGVVREISLKENLKISSVSGHGMGAYYATMFAFGYKPDYIEWIAFNFITKTKNKKPFTNEWQKIAELVLFKDIIDKKFEDSKYPLILPYYDKDQGKVNWVREGPINEALLANFILNDKDSNFEAAFPWEVLNQDSLRLMGSEKTIFLSVINKPPIFKNPDHHLSGLITRSIYQLRDYLNQQEDNLKVIHLPIKSRYIDVVDKSIAENTEFEKINTEILSTLETQDEMEY